MKCGSGSSSTDLKEGVGEWLPLLDLALSTSGHGQRSSTDVASLEPPGMNRWNPEGFTISLSHSLDSDGSAVFWNSSMVVSLTVVGECITLDLAVSVETGAVGKLLFFALSMASKSSDGTCLQHRCQWSEILC